MMGLFKRQFFNKLCSSTLAAAVTLSLCSVISASAAKTGVVSADSLNVRSGAGTNNSIVTSLKEGTSVTINSEVTDSSGQKWYKITAGKVSGYVAAWYIDVNSQSSASSSSSSSGTADKASTSAAASSDKDFEKYLTAQGFPESYKPMLRTLHKNHPNWIFMAQKTGFDWNEVLAEESILGRSLVPSYAESSWKSMSKDAYNYEEGYWYGLDGSWVQASSEIISYYLDPRNFLDDTYIFMFENLSYNPNVHNIAGVKAILSDTFMKGNFTAPDTGVTYSYAQTFMDAAEQSGVSPYHLAARCRNEQGVWGAPQSLGTTPGYEGYFNFFDVQAFATAKLTAEQMGCKYAMTTNPTYLLPWTNQYKSIVGGSIFLGTGYISKEQDTLYLQKFDIADGGNGYFYHQYMTCIFGQATEAVSLKNAYSDKVLASAMEFKIPVYDNMPAQICQKPSGDTSNNNYLKSLSVKGQTISPKFSKSTYSYKLTVDENVSSITINASAADSTAKISGKGTKELSFGDNKFTVTVTAQSGVKRYYTITVTRKGSEKKTVKGDVSGNSKLDIADALTIMKYSAGKTKLTKAQLTLADFNGDGAVNIIDALSVMKKLSGK